MILLILENMYPVMSLQIDENNNGQIHCYIHTMTNITYTVSSAIRSLTTSSSKTHGMSVFFSDKSWWDRLFVPKEFLTDDSNRCGMGKALEML